MITRLPSTAFLETNYSVLELLLTADQKAEIAGGNFNNNTWRGAVVARFDEYGPVKCKLRLVVDAVSTRWVFTEADGEKIHRFLMSQAEFNKFRQSVK